MADVFLSYSSADRVKAMQIERALSAAGHTVFWDQETPAGADWDNWIRAKLGEARTVVVLWSKASVASPNVRHEAMIARDAERLIPVLVEPLKPTDFPMGLYLVQAVQLQSWRGDAADPAFQRLVAEIAAKMGRPAPPPPTPARRSGALLWGAAAAGAALLGVAGFVLAPQFRAAPQTPVDVAAAMLVGDWRWEGVACGEGPHVTRDGDALIFAMEGTPSYRHAVEAVADGQARTLIVEPEAERGGAYRFSRNGATLHVETLADDRIDTWEKCP